MDVTLYLLYSPRNLNLQLTVLYLYLSDFGLKVRYFGSVLYFLKIKVLDGRQLIHGFG